MQGQRNHGGSGAIVPLPPDSAEFEVTHFLSKNLVLMIGLTNLLCWGVLLGYCVKVFSEFLYIYKNSENTH